MCRHAAVYIGSTTLYADSLQQGSSPLQSCARQAHGLHGNETQQFAYAHTHTPRKLGTLTSVATDTPASEVYTQAGCDLTADGVLHHFTCYKHTAFHRRETKTNDRRQGSGSLKIASNVMVISYKGPDRPREVMGAEKDALTVGIGVPTSASCIKSLTSSTESTSGVAPGGSGMVESLSCWTTSWCSVSCWGCACTACCCCCTAAAALCAAAATCVE